MTPVSLHPLYRDDPGHRLIGVGRDERAVATLRGQYRLVRAEGDRLAELFYDRLFREHPAVRPMFREDPAEQRAKLMHSLDTVIAFLDRPAQQGMYLRDLGRRHVAYGAKPEHYRVVSRLLADTIVELLGDRADADALQDWQDVFSLISDHMIAGAESATP